MHLNVIKRTSSLLSRAGGSGGRIRCFDSHFHVINDKFPLFMNQGYMPPIFKSADYQRKVLEGDSRLDVIGGAIVSGSFQMYDQGYLVDALSTLNDTTADTPPVATYVGVAQLEDINDKQCYELDAAGVRAIRFNISRGVTTDTQTIKHFAQHLHKMLGWHAEFYVDPKLLHDERKYLDLLVSLPVISIDHCGLTAHGQAALLELMFRRRQAGRKTFVKLTGFGRYQGARDELCSIVSTLLREYPRELLFATDLPGTRAPRPFESSDVDFLLELITKVFPDDADKRQQVLDDVFCDNALRLYSPAARTQGAEASSAAGRGAGIALEDRSAQGAGERLQKILAKLKFGSRRVCDAIIAEGRVTINGALCFPGTRVFPSDVVMVDGKEIQQDFEAPRYILMYKPVGVLTSSTDTHDRKTVLQLLQGVHERVFPVGRLDLHTSGILLLTNDGSLTHRLSHPRLSVEKTYVMNIDSNNWNPPDLQALAQRLVEGVTLIDQEEHNASGESPRVAKADSAVVIDQTRLQMVLTEGRKRVVRRMVAALGHTVTTLQRSGLANLTLAGLKPGMYRDLTPAELAELKGYIAKKEHAFDLKESMA